MSRVSLLPAVRAAVVGGRLPEVVSSREVEQAFRFEVAELLLGMAEAQGSTFSSDDLLQLTALAMRSENRRKHAEAAIIKVSEIAESTGCSFAVEKGAANAALLYQHSSHRPYNDVDLVVGHEGSTGLESFLTALGIHEESARSLVSLSERGTPIHEVAGRSGYADLDIHFNPFGMIVPVRDQAMLAAELRNKISIGGREVPVPSAELSLLIAAINIVRKGGGALWLVADASRLVSGKAGPLDWDRLIEIASAEGLLPHLQQVLTMLARELGLDVHEHLKSSSSAWWAPVLGEGQATKRFLRRGTFSVLHRQPVELAATARALRRWYLPSAAERTARSATGSASVSDFASRVPVALKNFYLASKPDQDA